MSARRQPARPSEIPEKPDQPSPVREQIFSELASMLGYSPTPNMTVPALLTAAEVDAAFNRGTRSLAERRLFASRLYLTAERAMDEHDRHWQEMVKFERLELKVLRKYLIELAKMVEDGRNTLETREG